MNSPEQTCADYGRFKIARYSTYDNPARQPVHRVAREGRELFSSPSPYEAAMFAEELYSRLVDIAARGKL
jgi:hypothetical protein